MKRKKRNSIDVLVEKFVKEFSQIPNFSLTQTDPQINRFFNFIILKLSEIQDFKTLFLRYYLPATNRALTDSKKEMIRSLYRKFININQDYLLENHFETIRLGYVGLFHKIENFQKELIVEIDQAFNEGRGDLKEFINDKFKYNFKNWHWDYRVKKINWINNRVKHDGGYPNEDIPTQLKYLPRNQKIRISREEFSEDLDNIANEYFELILKLYLMFGAYKFFSEEISKMESVPSELEEKIKELEENINLVIQ